MAPYRRLETHQTSLHTLTQVSPISAAARDAFPWLIAPSSQATCISCPVVAAEIALCPLPRGAEVRSQTQGHIWDLATQEARWNTIETARRREGNGFRTVLSVSGLKRCLKPGFGCSSSADPATAWGQQGCARRFGLFSPPICCAWGWKRVRTKCPSKRPTLFNTALQKWVGLRSFVL